MANCEENIFDIPVVSTEPANTDLVMFTDAAGNTVLRTWATIKTWMLAALSGQLPPTVNAGIDEVITLPTNFLTLSGTATGGSGTITGYQWSKVSGPSDFTIVNPNSASTDITNLIAGTYIFRLTVTNSNGQTAEDDVKVNVAYSTATTFSASWGRFATDPFTQLQTLDNLTWEGVGSFTNGTQIVADFGEVDGDWIAFKEPASQPIKTNWMNTIGFNEGTIPDFVWRPPFITAGVRYYVVRRTVTLNDNPTIFS